MSTEPVETSVEPTINQLQDRYARSIVEHGVGLLPGQDLYIRALYASRRLALRIGEAAYDQGASRVHYRFIDREEQVQLVRRAPALSLVAAVQVDLRAWHLEILRSRSPLLVLSEIAPSSHYEDLAREHSFNHSLYTRGIGEVSFSFIRQAMDQGLTACTIAPAPTLTWAARIFPELPAPEAETRLTELLVSVTEDEKAYAERQEQDEKLCERLEALRIRTVRVQGGGNDLLVRLPETARWIHSVLKTRAGQPYRFNFPSEEIFTTPDFRHTSGRLAARRPFRLSNGIQVEGAVLEFKEGRVVHTSATRGQEALEKHLSIDPGAGRLGEFALVSNRSPLTQYPQVFDHFLLDENAGCHVALGNGWKLPFGAEPLDDEDALESHGFNRSAVHTDIVFGNAGVTVTAIESEAGEVVLLVDGEWKI